MEVLGVAVDVQSARVPGGKVGAGDKVRFTTEYRTEYIRLANGSVGERQEHTFNVGDVHKVIAIEKAGAIVMMWLQLPDGYKANVWLKPNLLAKA